MNEFNSFDLRHYFVALVLAVSHLARIVNAHVEQAKNRGHELNTVGLVRAHPHL